MALLWQKAAVRRAQFSAAYEALDNSRTRTKRASAAGSEDRHLDTTSLHRLREIHRDLDRNNPIIEGLFTMEVDEIIGEGPVIQAKTADEQWNKRAEALWKEKMIDQPCDRTGRFAFPEFLGLQFQSYRRDGDVLTQFHDATLEGVGAIWWARPMAARRLTTALWSTELPLVRPRAHAWGAAWHHV